jgi:hypothetical protein
VELVCSKTTVLLLMLFVVLVVLLGHADTDAQAAAGVKCS